MKNLVFAGVATTALIFASPAAFASDSFAAPSGSSAKTEIGGIANGAKKGGGMKMRGGKMRGMRMGGHRMGKAKMRGMRGAKMRGMRGRQMRSGYRGMRGRWHGAMRAPGGYASYRRPFRGFIMPRYWINPSFVVSNYSNYGLRAPNSGYYWSRYYDDAVLTNNRGYVYDSVPNVNWQPAPASYAPQGGYGQPEYGPSIQPDREIYGWGEGAGDPRIGGTTEAGTYEGEWTGRFIDEDKRVYRGQWDGQYTNSEGKTYEGTYRGTMTGDPVFVQRPGNGPAQAGAPYPAQAQGYPAQAAPAPYPAPVSQGYPAPRPHVRHQGGYSVPNGYGRYERCLKKRGLTGGAIGAILGGFAGNRIAGRGDRLAGTLIGGGIGAIAGVGIEKATNKCKKYLPRRPHRPVATYPAPYPQAYPYPHGYRQHYGYGWMPGYYYPQQQQQSVTTITIIPGTATTTTTTTEEVIYEDVYTSAPVRRKGKGLRRPYRTKKRCNC